MSHWDDEPEVAEYTGLYCDECATPEYRGMDILELEDETLCTDCVKKKIDDLMESMDENNSPEIIEQVRQLELTIFKKSY